MSERGTLTFLQDVPVEVVVELGRTRQTIRQLAELDAGDVIELDRGDGDLVDLVVGGQVLARGEVVVVRDRVGVRIIEVLTEAARSAG